MPIALYWNRLALLSVVTCATVIDVSVFLYVSLLKMSPAGVFSHSRTCPGASCRVSRLKLLFPHQWETNFPQRLQLDPSPLLPGPSLPCCVSLVWKAAFEIVALESCLVSGILITNYDISQNIREIRVCLSYEYINSETTCFLFALQLKELVAVSCGCEHERPQGLGRRSVWTGSFLQHVWWDGNHGNDCQPFSYQYNSTTTN